MKINIYSPVNGEIKNIEDCKDAMFADRMLGDGFVIVPEKNDFKSFFDEAKVTMVFDTKHAYGFDIQGLQFLLHCGMDTVVLKGEGFSTTLQVGDLLKKDDNLFSVDIDLVKKANLSIETPIVFEINNLSKYTINNLKLGKVNQGDLICTIDFELKTEKEKEKTNPILDPIEFFNSDNKYQLAAKQINKLVGTKENYQEVYNCMTRLRFSIKNKDLVNVVEIRKHPMVKGVVWNGNEIQIVIGQDVYKLKDEVVKNNNEINAIQASINVNKQKVSLIKRFMAMFSGIMIRLIPVLIGTGLIQATVTILIQSKIMPDIVLKDPMKGQIALGDPNLKFYWALLFVAGRVANIFLGVVIAVSASKYFKLDTILGATIGLMLCAPMLYFNGGPYGIGQEWTLFKIKQFNPAWLVPNPDKPNDVIAIPIMLNVLLNKLTVITVNTMNVKIFVIIPAIYIAKKLDTWIKTWLHISLDLMFRPFLIFLIVLPLSFFVIGPIWNFIEALFGLASYFLSKIPLGIGIGIFIGLWQIAVIFGIHIILAIIVGMDSIINLGQTFFVASELSVWAQVGALIGVIIITRNAALRKQGIQMLPAGILGITEPILYGINLPKKRPLFAGVAAAFVAGCLSASLQVTMRVQSGMGIFEMIGFFAEPNLGGKGILDPISNGLWNMLTCVVSVGLGILFCLLFYKERKTEKSLLANIIDQSILLTKLQLNLNKEKINELKNIRNDLIKFIDKDSQKIIKDVERQIQKYISVNQKINNLKEKEEALKEKIMIKGKSAIAHNQIERASQLMTKYNAINFEQEISKLTALKEEKYNAIDFEALSNLINNLEEKVNNKLNEFNFDNQFTEKLKPIINNALNNLQIYYGLSDSKPIDINLNEEITSFKKALKKEKKLNKVGVQ